MNTVIEGKVAAIIDDTTLVLNVGSEQGVQEGMAFAIFAAHGEIEDPDSGQSLGRWEAVKARVVATHVQERLCTVRAPVVGEAPVVGDTRPLSAMMGRALGGPRPGPRAMAAAGGAGRRCSRGRAPEPAHCRGRRSAVVGGG